MPGGRQVLLGWQGGPNRRSSAASGSRSASIAICPTSCRSFAWRSPGIQFLFAFLLVVPFQQGWTDVGGVEKRVYYVALVLTAVASICFIAPSARHRLRFRARDLDWVVTSSNRLMVAGLICLGGAMIAVILLITMVVFSHAFAYIAAALIAVLIAWAWFGSPLIRDMRHD